VRSSRRGVLGGLKKEKKSEGKVLICANPDENGKMSQKKGGKGAKGVEGKEGDIVRLRISTRVRRHRESKKWRNRKKPEGAGNFIVGENKVIGIS